MRQQYKRGLAALIATGTLALASLFAQANAHEALPDRSPADIPPFVQVLVVDRDDNRILPLYWHYGKAFVAGEPGHRYSIRLVSQTDRPALAVVSVDGLNILSGEPAAHHQAGHVLLPGEQREIRGWRKNWSEVAQFEFTSARRSYAASVSQPDNVGVIGVAVFRERPHVLLQEPQGRPSLEAEVFADAPAPSAAPQSAKSAASRSLGTGHGSREYAPARAVDFERATQHPEQVVVIHYDSRANLIRRGIIPDPARANADPQPFPGGFVPDPPHGW